jgi:hypothetical protein
MGGANSVQPFFIYNITQDRNLFRLIISKTEKLKNGIGYKIGVTFSPQLMIEIFFFDSVNIWRVKTEMHAEMHSGFPTNCLLYLSDINQIWNR